MFESSVSRLAAFRRPSRQTAGLHAAKGMRFSALIAGELSDDPKVESVTVSQTRAGYRKERSKLCEQSSRIRRTCGGIAQPFICDLLLTIRTMFLLGSTLRRPVLDPPTSVDVWWRTESRD